MQASRPVTALLLGNLADVTKQEAAGMLPGSTAFYALRVAMDAFKCVSAVSVLRAPDKCCCVTS